MDGTRFDTWTRRIGETASRRQIVRAALAGLGIAAGLTRVDDAMAKTCRPLAAICRNDGDCCSGNCLHADATGRRRCGEASDSRCPSPDGLDEGALVCASDGGFCTVSNGVMIYRACAPGTTCIESNDSIVCDFL